MKEGASFAGEWLKRTAARKDRVRRFSLFLGAGAATFCILLAFAAVDYRWPLPVLVRWLGAGLLAGSLAFGLVRWLRLRRRRTPAKQAALDLESREPRLGCEISTAAEYLSGQRRPAQRYEAEFVEALRARAERKLRRTRLSYSRGLALSGYALSGVGLGLLLFLALVPMAWTAVKRAALPWLGLSYTRVQVTPGNSEIAVHRDLPVEAKFTGRLPHTPRLQWRGDKASAWKTAPLSPGQPGQFHHTFKDLAGSLEYRVSGSDAASPVYRIRTYTPPKVAAWEIEAQPPKYTGQPAIHLTSPNLSLLRGTQVTYRLRPDTALRSARLVFSSAAKSASNLVSDLVLRPETHSPFWVAKFTVRTNTDYHIRLRSSQGRPGASSKRYHVAALPDRPPSVEILDPGGDLRADATNKVPIKIRAKDDYGLRQVRLVFNKLGSAEQTIVCSNQVNADGLIAASLDLTPLHLQEYELVAYHAEATDNNTLDGPGVGKSDVYFMEITHLPGGQCLCQRQSKQVNLLTLQKQIIADTSLVRDSDTRHLSELAARETQARQYAEIYRGYFQGANPWDPALAQMNAAIAAMDDAAHQLESYRRRAALPLEEGALANLYQLLRLKPAMPPLPLAPAANPTPPPPDDPMHVVLKAIKELDESQKKKLDEQLTELLRQVRRLAQQQRSISESKGKAPASQTGRSGSDASTRANLARDQRQVARDTQAIARKLDRLGSQYAQLDPHPGNLARAAASWLERAAQAFEARDTDAAWNWGGHGLRGLKQLRAALEGALDLPAHTDVAAEAYPPQYESLIDAYFHRLSFAK